MRHELQVLALALATAERLADELACIRPREGNGTERAFRIALASQARRISRRIDEQPIRRLCDRPSCNERLDDGEALARCPMCDAMRDLFDQAWAKRFTPKAGDD
jgi:hypothetical protein